VTAVEIGIAGLAAALIFVLVLLQAGQRYLPVDGWTWTGELARYGLVWLTFTATGVLVTRDGHIALQIVDELRPEWLVRAVHVLALVIVSLTGAGFAVACWSLIQESGNLTTPSLGMPMQYVYVLPLLGFASTTVRAAVAAYLTATRGITAVDHSDELAIQVNGPHDYLDPHTPGGRA
jgi:TRAP-type C4-dicarboxylate transport system permease small subunit